MEKRKGKSEEDVERREENVKGKEIKKSQEVGTVSRVKGGRRRKGRENGRRIGGRERERETWMNRWPFHQEDQRTRFY